MSFLKNLNPEQVEAALHNEGPMLILAGAGSGKTTVLVARAGRMVDEKIVRADSLCVLTFTNKAARELKHRVGAKLGRAGDKIWAGTFHSFGLMLLKEYGHTLGLPKRFSVVDQRDAEDIIKELMADLKHHEKKSFDTETLLQRISSWRETGQRAAKSEDAYEEATEWLLPRYESRLQKLALVDFDGLLLEPIKLLENPEIAPQVQGMFSQVMVDEFQDTNPVQMKLLKKLTKEHKNLTVVGDDDQAIYGWRGACVSNILEFPKTFKGCKVVRLERNYRCAPPILNLANAVILKNTTRHDKVLKACGTFLEEKMPELFVFEAETDEAEWVAQEIETARRDGVPLDDMALLYRSNGQSGWFEAELRRLNIDYKVSGGTSFFDRREVRDCLAFLRCAFRPHDVAFRRILNLPPRGIGEKTYEKIQAIADESHMSFVDAARSFSKMEGDPKTSSAVNQLFEFLAAINAAVMTKDKPGEAFADELLRIGYKDHLRTISAEAASGDKRWKAVDIFGTFLNRHFSTRERTPKMLAQFLEYMELRDDGDDRDKTPKVSLMTLHACKGLEFGHVYLVGVEEDLLPHKTLGSDVQEERRLFYVGVTRAKRKLVLTRVKSRPRHGRRIQVVPSRFLTELPPGLIEVHESGRPLGEEGRQALLKSLYEKLNFNTP